MGGVAYRLYAKEKIAVTVTGEGGAALGKFDGDPKGISVERFRCVAVGDQAGLQHRRQL